MCLSLAISFFTVCILPFVYFASDFFPSVSLTSFRREAVPRRLRLFPLFPFRYFCVDGESGERRSILRLVISFRFLAGQVHSSPGWAQHSAARGRGKERQVSPGHTFPDQSTPGPALDGDRNPTFRGFRALSQAAWPPFTLNGRFCAQVAHAPYRYSALLVVPALFFVLGILSIVPSS